MDIRIKLFFVAFLATYNSFSQIKLYPELGMAFTNNRMAGGNQQHIKAQQLNLNHHFSFELEKKIKNYAVSLAVLTTGVNLSTKYYSPTEGWLLGRSLIGTSFELFGVRLKTKELYTLQRASNLNSTDNSLNERFDNNRRKLVVTPKFGLFFTRLQNTWWQSIESDSSTTEPQETSSSITLSTNDGWDVGPEGSTKIEENKYGASLQFGLDFQFRKLNREGLRLSLFYNLGLNTLLNTTYTVSIEGDIKTVRMKTNGSYLGFCVSYPITILKAKGNRRWDKK